LALPVCTPAELAAAAKGGSAIDAIVRRPGPMDLRRQLNAVTEARGIDAALAELQSGAPAVIDVVTGVRIEADGRATLPRLEDAGRQAADRVARARDAAAEVEALTLDLPVAQDALVGAGAQVQQIESALGVLRQRAAQAMATTSAAVETARTAARAAGLPRIEQARVRLQQRRETWRAERQAAVQELKRLEAAESAQAQASAVNVLERVRAEADAAARAVEDEERLATAIVVEAVDAALEAAEQGVAAERERAREAREAAHQNRESGRQALADRLAAVREVVEGARAAAEAARVEAGEGRAAKVEAEATLAAAVRAEATTDAEIARCHLQLADARSLLEQSELRAAKLTSQCEQATGRVEAAALVLEDATRTAGRADSAVALGRGVLEDARSRATRSEVAMATAEERLRAARQSLEAARSRRSDAAAVLTDISSRRGALHESEVSALAAMESAVVELAGLDETRATVWDRYQVARERQSRGREGLAQAEMDAGQLRVRERDLAGRSEDAKGELERVQTEIEVLRRRAEERYQAVLPAMLDRLHARGSIGLGVSDEALLGVAVGGQRIEGVAPRDLSATQLMDRMRVQEVAARLEDNRAQLARLGEVNLGALDEHVDLARRHTELVSQREDLEASIRTIRAAIAKMNRTCRQRFRDAFDRINSNFQESYPRLVGGGAARLSLTNEEDLLETGVDIFVQPPGKRLQNLSLLSGGEKAMTAIALLIAVFQVKPSPFCVLDEVDAPLDEANGARFNEMLKDLSRITQFVVVTHNRKTMECADTLYGVTMARPGVSRLVAVDL
jgi:chromosome segregation ATPase